ncbi:hypothetical protein [Chelativorans salis]|uniref:Uncharacterized protein n=1 Tax=Chelativorans salis TaxID=2978478 RepID=A0ABT2LJE7_9HYPH|nr:hypothetical protein [Chelativorans sp. EGI FJ00035]MCT7374722.1 hypothetical protein [Chelativorans sp. EGI FJ00035]
MTPSPPRLRLETTVEVLVNLLDEMDGDEDLEEGRRLGAVYRTWREVVAYYDHSGQLWSSQGV